MMKNVISYTMMYPLLRDDQKRLRMIYEPFTQKINYQIQIQYYDMKNKTNQYFMEVPDIEKVTHSLYRSFILQTTIKAIDFIHLSKNINEYNKELTSLQRSLIYLPI